jgi:Amt family ammonium transporter
MVNITYGVLADDGSILSSRGTDLIAYLEDGTVVAYNPGDLSWMLAATALVWIMIVSVSLLRFNSELFLAYGCSIIRLRR